MSLKVIVKVKFKVLNYPLGSWSRSWPKIYFNVKLPIHYIFGVFRKNCLDLECRNQGHINITYRSSFWNIVDWCWPQHLFCYLLSCTINLIRRSADDSTVHAAILCDKPISSGRKPTSLSECPGGGWARGKNIEDKICFSNICGINSNIDAVHHYLQSNRPAVLFLAETKISKTAPINHLNFLNYENGGVVAFVRSSLSCSRDLSLESDRKDILWLRLNSKTSPKFICCLYRSPSNHNWDVLLEYLAVQIDFLNINHPASEVVLLAGRAVEAFALTQGLTQLVTSPTFFPALLDLFLTTHPVPYSTAVRFRSEAAGLRDFFCSFPWRDARQQTIKAHRTYLQNPTVENRPADVESRNKYNEAVRNAKNQHDIKVRHRVMSQRNDSRSFWTLAKQNVKNFPHSSLPPLTCQDGTIVFDSKTKAEVLAKIFAANSTMDVPTNAIVRRVLLSLDINKDSGPDLIPATVLKRYAAELAPVLSRLFQRSYESGTFPENWKFAHVQQKADPYNYRPIALLSVISKVMERCINRELLDYLERHSLISDRQYGFRHQRSTGDLLAYVTLLWSKLIQSHGEAHVVALDITKAFDQLWHAALLSKLPSYGHPEQICRCVADFISGRKTSVVLDGFSSSSHNVNAGVPQGSILAPTLFLLHINDLLSCTINPIHRFADDSTLHAGIQSDRPISAAKLEKRRLATTSSLTRDLEAITAWGRNNLVQFNASKTQYCTLTNKKRPSAHTVSIDGRVLPKSHSFRLVGVQITEDLIWHEHISSIAADSGKKLGYLFRAKKYFSPHDLLTLYKVQIRPSLEYCSHIWGAAAPTTLSMLDAVQRRAVRLIDDSSLTDSLGTLSHRRAVGDPALLLPQTRLTSASHPNRVKLRTSRTGRYDRSFVPRVSKLWNNRQEEAFPSSTNLRQFKNRINKISLGSSYQPRKMELNREHFRAIIYYIFQRQLSHHECLAELLSVFDNEAPHHLSDDPRVGAPKTAVTQENVDAVRKLIIEDKHVTYREIEASLTISKTSIQKILHEELGVRKLVSRWIPHLFTEEQKATRVNWCQKTLDRFNSGNSKNVYSIIYCYEPENKRQSAVWVFQGEEKPTKVIRSRSVSKKMVETFVSKAGHIATIPLNEQRTVTADWYPTICLPKVITELLKINPERRIILHQGNASSQLRGQRFQSPEETVDAFKNDVLDLPPNERNECFQNWFERMRMCINLPSGVPQGSVLGPTNPRFTYKISDHNIEAVSSHTDLGVVRSFKGSDVKTCAYIYKAFVRPILEFAGPVWDTVLLRDRNLVESRRLRGDLIVTFRILHGLMGTNLMHLYHLSRSNLRGHSFKLHKEPFKTTLIASKCSMIAGGFHQG
ncbi:unnamed protein product [Acanthoscelides obtectus]|uniref:Reverse transcriptase domain-containing protein n=1 Tax=Acanthoscelides obtectus TaxID=200917 RepID=A0A9P0PZP2_ACAOB|nr:unnamed protein product [Acanthoscelides obtectus]CAK1683787.1 RNA-directed DNA polymerase from mobile element jockey [Acanthoscelides obtectus]